MDWTKLLALLSGKKTYLAAGLAALWPILAPLLGFSGEITEQSVSQILLAMAVAALRAGVANAIPGIGPLMALLPQLIGLLQQAVAHGPQLIELLERLKAEADKAPAPAPQPAPNFDAFTTGAAAVELIAAPSPDRSNPSYRLPLILLALGLMPAAASAAPPTAVLVGPIAARPGLPIALDVSHSTGDIQHYLLRVTSAKPDQRTDVPVVQYAIASQEAGKPPVLDRGKPFLWGVPGSWRVELTVVSADGERSDAEIVIDVPGSSPCPEPTPTPTPTPQPNPPLPPPPEPGPIDPAPPRPVEPGEFGVAPQLYALARKVGKPGDCKMIADKLESLAAKCDAGASMQSVINEIPAHLATLPAEWNWLKTAAKPSLIAIHGLGKLPNAAALSRLLKEMESAFRAAAG